MSRHVRKQKIWLLGAVLCAVVSPNPTWGQPAATNPPANAPADAVDPNAIRAVDRMAAYLRTLKSFDIKVSSTIESVLPDGQKVLFAGTTNYQVQPPKGLYADVRTDRIQRRFYYNGSQFAMYAPRMRVYTSVPAPGTIRETLDLVVERYGIPLPLADLFYWGGSPEDVRKPTSAKALGYANIDGVDAEHFAFREPGIDYQLWIQRGATPLPLKMVITDTADPERPQYTANMKWATNVPIDPSIFTFKPPAGVVRIQQVDLTK